MTALEMQYRFQQKFYEMDTPTRFTTYDIQNFLNEAQSSLVTELSQLVDNDDTIRTYLYPITVNWSINNAGSRGVHPNGYIITLPSNYFRCLKEQVRLSDSTYVNVKPQRLDYYNSNLENPFKKPYEDLYWRIEGGVDSSGNKLHEVITNGTSFSSYHMTYLKKPTDIDIINQVDCKLHELIHPAIVDKAVAFALASLQRAGLVTQESNT